MSTIPKVIADKVAELLKAIAYAKDDLQLECAEMSLNGDFVRLTQLSTKHSNLQELETDIVSVLKNFENKQKIQRGFNSEVQSKIIGYGEGKLL